MERNKKLEKKIRAIVISSLIEHTNSQLTSYLIDDLTQSIVSNIMQYYQINERVIENIIVSINDEIDVLERCLIESDLSERDKREESLKHYRDALTDILKLFDEVYHA